MSRGKEGHLSQGECKCERRSRRRSVCCLHKYKKSQKWKDMRTPTRPVADWMQISGMKASYLKLLENWNPEASIKNPNKAIKSKNIPETSNGDIRSTRGSRASAPLNTALLEQLLSSYPCQQRLSNLALSTEQRSGFAKSRNRNIHNENISP